MPFGTGVAPGANAVLTATCGVTGDATVALATQGDAVGATAGSDVTQEAPGGSAAWAELVMLAAAVDAVSVPVMVQVTLLPDGNVAMV